MYINEVENIVGLSKKSIRYYEDNGLINPKRDNNSYRIYNNEDINKLKIIKFLRELNVSIRDLKLLNENKLSLEECLMDTIKKIDNLTKNYEQIKLMCNEIIKENVNFNNIEIDKYFKEINILNKKERFTMYNKENKHIKQIVGAVMASLIFSGLFIFLLILIGYIGFNFKLPIWLLILVELLLLLPLIGIIYNLVIRIKEIKGGEEDDALKY